MKHLSLLKLLFSNVKIFNFQKCPEGFKDKFTLSKVFSLFLVENILNNALLQNYFKLISTSSCKVMYDV